MGAAGGATGARRTRRSVTRIVEPLDVGARVTLRGRRRVYDDAQPRPLDTLPADWRALLADWAKRSPRAKWKTLLTDAGHARVELAHALKDWLLAGGWIALEESRKAGRWEPVWVEFRDPAALLGALGLDAARAARERWLELRAHMAGGPLAAYLPALDALPPARALERAALLDAIVRWRADGRHGTRRDFAQYARGATKAISAAEWQWLEGQLDLAAAGIERHAPTLYLRAPIALVTDGGEVDLHAARDVVGLTADTLRRTRSIRSRPACWRVIENRTSFERAARTLSDADAIVWVPGFAPTWWSEAMRRLIALAPAPAQIACDPDPAGIEIALAAGRLWTDAGLPWTPWRMNAAALRELPRRRPLTAHDRARLGALMSADLPPDLADLARWMDEHGEKGEQEALI